MPSKRRRLARLSRQVRLRDLPFTVRFAFLAPVCLPGERWLSRTVPCPWQTWSDYFDLYEQVRVELLAIPRHQAPAAEELREVWLAGGDMTAAVDAYRGKRDVVRMQPCSRPIKT